MSRQWRRHENRLAGQGAFGITPSRGAARTFPASRSSSLAGGRPAGTEEVAKKWKIPHWTTDLAESLKQPGVEAVILATPTQMHAEQGEHVHARRQACADRDSDGRHARRHRAHRAGRRRKPASSPWRGHVRRFNPSHQWVHKKIKAGELKIQQMDVQTYFFRRTNMNAPASRAAGPTICCGITPATRSICSSTRPASCRRSRTRSQGPMHPELEDRDGHGHSAEGAVGRDLHPVAVVQQRRAARHASSATSATTAPTSPVTTIWSTATNKQIDVSQGRCLDERHRAAGPRVLRRHQGKPRAQFQRSRNASTRCARSTGSSAI